MSRAPDPPSTGLVQIERVLHEMRDRGGRSPTLERWTAQLQEQLDRYRTQPGAVKEIRAVETAMALATELMQTVRQEAVTLAAKKP